jgi:hypothetical protein
VSCTKVSVLKRSAFCQSHVQDCFLCSSCMPLGSMVGCMAAARAHSPTLALHFMVASCRWWSPMGAVTEVNGWKDEKEGRLAEMRVIEEEYAMLKER